MPPDPAAPRPATPQLDLGLLLPPQAPGRLREALAAELPVLLAERFPGARWQVSVVEDALVSAPADSLDLLEAARDRMLDEDWDLTVVLTELPLRQGRRALLSQASPVHRVGLVSLPAVGPLQVRQRALEATARLVAALLGQDSDAAGDRQDDALARRMAELSTDLPESGAGNPVQFAARVLGGNLRLLLGMIRANRPWRLAMGLSRALTVAVATGVLALVTADLWLLSAAYGPARLLALGLVSVGAVSLTLILGAELWERSRRRREREQVTLFNLATVATVVIGVLVFYTALFLLSLLGALLLVESSVLAEAVGHPVGAAEYGKLAWLTATLAAVGGALGAGLESDDVVRQAAYTRQDAVSLDDAA